MTAGQSEGLDGVVDILQRGFLDFAFLDALVIRIGTDRIGGSRSVGSRRSFQGIHLGGINASSVEIKEDSLTVQESISSS